MRMSTRKVLKYICYSSVIALIYCIFRFHNGIGKPKLGIKQLEDNLKTKNNASIGIQIDSSTNEIAHKRNHTQLVYTRVLKCGSTTMYRLIQNFEKIQNFTIRYEMTWTPIWNQSEIWLQNKVRDISYTKTPWIYIRHVHFIDFIRYGGRETQPGYFGIVRDPVERIISWYYYRLKQYNPTVISLDDCVRKNYPNECVHVHSKIHNNFAIIPFFCGHDEICLYPNNASLAIAKSNVEKYYSVVGLSEKFIDFLHVLEYMFPNYFSGLARYYTSESSKTKNVTHRKQEVREETKAMLKSQLGLEYDFYYFVKNRFSNLHKKLVKMSKIPESSVM